MNHTTYQINETNNQTNRNNDLYFQGFRVISPLFAGKRIYNYQRDEANRSKSRRRRKTRWRGEEEEEEPEEEKGMMLSFLGGSEAGAD